MNPYAPPWRHHWCGGLDHLNWVCISYQGLIKPRKTKGLFNNHYIRILYHYASSSLYYPSTVTAVLIDTESYNLMIMIMHGSDRCKLIPPGCDMVHLLLDKISFSGAQIPADQRALSPRLGFGSPKLGLPCSK